MTSKCMTIARSALLSALIFCAALIRSGFAGDIAPDTALPSVPRDGHVIVAYYFYTTLRCDNCLRIETWSKEALDSAFVEEMSAGSLWWRPLNTDLPEYAHFIADYALEQKSPVIAEYEDGVQRRWKKCERVWDLLEDKPGFVSYVQTEVNVYLSP